MDFDQRVEAVAAAERFQNDPTGVNEDSREQQDSTAAQILLGREELPHVSITNDQVRTAHRTPPSGNFASLSQQLYSVA